MRALFAALAWMKAHPAEAAEVTSKRLGWPLEAVLGAHRISSPLFSLDGSINVEALAAMQDTLLEYGVIKKRLPLEEHVAREFTPVRT